MPKFVSSIRIRVSDVSRQNKLKESTIFELLQEVACEHAEKMGVGYKDLCPLNLAWAVSKIDLNIYAYPKARETITIETWATTRSKIATERDFIAYDAQGNKIFEAQSQWVLFDITKRRFERLSVLKGWKQCAEIRANADIHKKLLKATTAQITRQYHPRKDDIDVNNHLNNTIYPRLAIDTLPLEFCSGYHAKNISISFLAELKEDDIIESICEIDGLNSYHTMRNKGTNVESARINIKWDESLNDIQ